MNAFENDDALDWLFDLEAAEDATLVRAALDPPTGRDTDPVSVARLIAAAEVVAAALGRPADDLPGAATVWVATHRRHIGIADATLAVDALAVVADSPDLDRLQGGTTADWARRIAALQLRLGARRQRAEP